MKIDKRPRYVVVMEAVQNYIMKHHLAVGDKIPAEPEWMEEFHVSRATVRQAMQELENAGIIEKKHGIGTFVAEEKMSIQMEGFFSFSEEARKVSNDVYTKILKFKRTLNAPKKVTELFGTSDVIELERLRYIDNEPTLLELTYIPGNIVKGRLPKEFEFESLYDYLKSLGIRHLSGSEKLTPHLPTSYEASKLQIDKQSLLLQFTRILSEEKPIEYTITIFKPGKIGIETKIERKL